jgi:hypothetical protein
VGALALRTEQWSLPGTQSAGPIPAGIDGKQRPSIPATLLDNRWVADTTLKLK